MRPAQLLAVTTLGLSANAYAASLDSLDLYYSSADLGVNGTADSDDGALNYSADVGSLDGFGVKFRGAVADDYFFSGEYQRADAEQVNLALSDADTGQPVASDGPGDVSYTEWRLGLGLPFHRSSSITLYGVLEYIDTEVKVRFDSTDPDSGETVSHRAEERQNGGALHAGALFNPTAAWSVYGQLGYVRLDGLDGIEYLAGTALQVHRYGGLFVEYRDSDLDGGGNRKLELTPLRFGVYLLVQ